MRLHAHESAAHKERQLHAPKQTALTPKEVTSIMLHQLCCIPQAAFAGLGQNPVNPAPRHAASLSLRSRQKCRAKDEQSSGSEDSPSKMNALSATVKRKQKQVADLLQDMGMESLEDRLQSATASPSRPPHRFAQLIQVPGER